MTEVETKSGTNEVHGDAWEFLRNTDLNANNYFNNLNHVGRPAFHRNQFGGTLGGPILRNKVFFFLDYEGIRVSQPQTATSTLPSVAQQQMVATGNFANFGTTIYNPFIRPPRWGERPSETPSPGTRFPRPCSIQPRCA